MLYEMVGILPWRKHHAPTDGTLRRWSESGLVHLRMPAGVEPCGIDAVREQITTMRGPVSQPAPALFWKMNIKDIHVGDYVRFTDKQLEGDNDNRFSECFGRIVRIVEIAGSGVDGLKVSAFGMSAFSASRWWLSSRFSPVSPLESAVLKAREEKAL